MTTNDSKLSDGSLDLILIEENQNQTPIVQILGSKMMANNRLRVVISDGRTLCQHCIMISDEIQTLFNQGELEKFTVVRLEQYTVSTIPKKENIPVILVQKLKILKKGDEVGRRLEAGEAFDSTTDSSVPSTNSSNNRNEMMDTSMNTSINKSSIQKPARAPVSNDVEIRPDNVCPISVLTPFYNAWTIRAMCVNKSQIRTYNKQNSQGRVFNFDLCDDTGEIRVTCFNEECDRFYDIIQKDRCYYVGRGTIKSANKKFSTLNNDYEITLNQNSFVKPCLDKQIEAPKIRYKFIPLNRIAEMEANTTIDVIGIIRSVNEIETLVSRKTSKELLKRDIIIVDKSMTEARLTLWGEKAQLFSGEPNQVIALKGVSVGDFKGKTLSARDSTNITINPDVPEKHLLITWYNALDSNENFNQLSKSSDQAGDDNLSKNRFIGQILPNKISEGESLNFFTMGTIQGFNRINNHLYKSCSNANCQKKVVDNDGSGVYYCSKCDQTSAVFEWRLMLSIMLSDVSGSFWATLFQEQAEKLIGKSVNELSRLYEEDQTLYANVIDGMRFKQCYFRIYTRLENYNGEMRMRHTVGQVFEFKPKKVLQNLIQSIEKMSI